MTRPTRSTRLIDGWASDDTHHRGGFEWSHGGLLHMLEGVVHVHHARNALGPVPQQELSRLHT